MRLTEEETTGVSAARATSRAPDFMIPFYVLFIHSNRNFLSSFKHIKYFDSFLHFPSTFDLSFFYTLSHHTNHDARNTNSVIPRRPHFRMYTYPAQCLY